jgi:RimJ/RimL family protein N-acetyltransferase
VYPGHHDVVVPPTRSDAEITIRPMTLADVEPHLRGDDEEQARWLTAGEHSTFESTRAWVERNAEYWAAGGPVFNFGVVENASGSLVGFVEAHAHGGPGELSGVDAGEANLSYGVYPAFRRRGYASRAVGLACDLLAGQGFAGAVIRVDPDNGRSLGVARKCGFDSVGTVVTADGGRLAVFKRRLAARPE